MTKLKLIVVALGIVVLGLGAAAERGNPLGDTDIVPAVFVQPPTTTPPAPANDDCHGLKPTESYPAEANPTPSAAVDRIKVRGKLIAGVSADTLLFGARDPFTGRLEGLDIDLVRELARTIFGSNDGDAHIQLRVITYAQRLPLLEAGEIDVVAHTMTINCTRWNRIAFSTEYYSAGQQLLVRVGSGVREIEELPKKSRVCVPAGGTSVENLASYTKNEFQAVTVDDITQCLVKMQQGQADAVLSDDTVVKGMAQQDPYVSVVGRFLSSEPYGMGFKANATDLVQVANAMLDRLRADGFVELLVRNKLPADTVIPKGLTGRPLPTR